MVSRHPIAPSRRSARLAGHDYAQASGYLVSTMVDDRTHRFGGIANGVIELNDAGQLIHAGWLKLQERFPGIELDAFVVMPNHFHGIIFIGTDPDVVSPSLTRIMQVFKSETAVEYGRGIRAGAFPPVKRALWQRSFHDWIISSERVLASARAYVDDNPRRWHEERSRP